MHLDPQHIVQPLYFLHQLSSSTLCLYFLLQYHIESLYLLFQEIYGALVLRNPPHQLLILPLDCHCSGLQLPFELLGPFVEFQLVVLTFGSQPLESGLEVSQLPNLLHKNFVKSLYFC